MEKIDLAEREKNPIIGEGLQYTVYDTGDGRVIKRLKTLPEQEAKLVSWKITDPKEIEEKLQIVNRLLVESNAMIRTLLERYETLSPLLGNPIFENDNEYSQDKTLILGSYLGGHSIEEGQTIIDRYISLVHTLWQHGVGDLKFNFTINNGIADNGSIMQLDFGECGFDKSVVMPLLQEQFWLGQNSYEVLPGGPLKYYVAKRFKEEFTVQKLNELWKTAATRTL